MGKWLLLSGILALGGTLIATDADAGRLGGGRSVGAQRSVTAPPARPGAAADAAGGTRAEGRTAAAPAQTGNRWLPILGGLALGGMLGYLFGGNGLMGILLIAGLAILAVMVVRALMARRRQSTTCGRCSTPACANRSTFRSRPRRSRRRPPRTTAIPAGFDASGFLRAAKMNFLKLQQANDAGRLDEIREFTTDELYEELRKDFGRSAGQATDIASLDADLLEFATEGNRHWASVRFSGTVREAPRAEPEAFTEVWNLVKPADGSTGWLLAGIQQMH
jgi:predicted lipid-binding transport protein (Tim44 family)